MEMELKLKMYDAQAHKDKFTKYTHNQTSHTRIAQAIQNLIQLVEIY